MLSVSLFQINKLSDFEIIMISKKIDQKHHQILQIIKSIHNIQKQLFVLNLYLYKYIYMYLYIYIYIKNINDIND